MPAKDPTARDRGADGPTLEALFGEANGASPALVTLAVLSKLTLKQLLDGAKILGLTAVSKLKKDALAQVVLDAWHARGNGDNVHRGGGGSGSARGGSIPEGTASLAKAAAADIAEAPAPEADQVPPMSHKFEVGQPGRASTEESRNLLRESAKEIPWGYGRDRVTAMAVDPDRLFAYWEVLDDSITAARAKLGPGGQTAWLNLRVYDTTARIFDGTNAHAFFDHRIERGDRQWFFTIGRPTSELIIELGLKSDEGYFAKIARSGRVEFPRRDPAPWVDPEWLTVRVAGQIEHAGIRVLGRHPRYGAPRAGGGAAAAGPGGAGAGGAPAASRRVAWEDAIHVAGGGLVEREQWEEVHAHGTIEEHRRFRWDGPLSITSWEGGPFPYPVEIPEPVRESYSGKTHVLRLAGRTHVVYGPWQVIIRGLGAQQTRVVLSRWEVYRTWAEERGHEAAEFATEFSGGGGSSERMMGASDRRWAGGSEVRLGGASELYFLKASELRLGGSSERMYAGASEWSARGASERLYAGSSEMLRGGASERLLGMASGSGFLGGSEGRLVGGAFAASAGVSPGAATGTAAATTGGYPEPSCGPSSDSSSGSSSDSSSGSSSGSSSASSASVDDTTVSPGGS